jgi:DNA-binding PadR family transcriptional regulator
MFHRFYEEAMRGRRRGFGHEGFGREGREGFERGPGHRGWRGGFGPREGRMFDGGELRWVILSLVAEKPRHGYEVIKELGERVGGDYSPSPGVVYPTLTLLEDMGYAAVSPDEGGRKLYTVTPEGEKALAENKAQVDAIFARFAGREETDDPRAFGSIIRAMMNLRAAAKLRLRGRNATPEQIQAIVDALDEAAKKIERV